MVMFKAMLNSTETKMHEPFGGGGVRIHMLVKLIVCLLIICFTGH